MQNFINAFKAFSSMNTKNKEKLNELIYSYNVDNNYLEEENKILKATVDSLNKELAKFKEMPLLVCSVKEILPNGKAIAHLQNGNEFMVNVSDSLKDVTAGDTVVAEQKNLTIVEKINSMKTFNVEQFVIIEKPQNTWEQVGGLCEQINEIKEIIELPLLNPKLFEKVGIMPPKGILLYGPPGTGKTLLAKAVAASTHSTFIELVASELVQKFIGEGAKLVKDIFLLAREKSPAIVFIDEIDALAGTRIELGTSGEREVQRTFMQLLAELDGFKPLDNVKLICCTNRKDILDPAIIRPGRLDRLIEVSFPDEKGRLEIFKIHTARMTLKKVDLEELAKKTENVSGAEIKSICTEAGYFAIREKRFFVSQEDFEKAKQKVLEKEKKDKDDYKKMFN
jgi:proteasome regulatory subunit